MGPGFNDREFDFVGFGVVFAFAKFEDFGIEDFDADAELGGFGFANAVVFERVQGGEAGQGDFVGIFNFRFLILDLGSGTSK